MISTNSRTDKTPFSLSETLTRYNLDLLFIFFISLSLFASCYIISSDLFSISLNPSLAMSNLLSNLSTEFFISITISFLELVLCSNLSDSFFLSD